MGSCSFDREATVYLAKLADQVGCHDEMAEAMKSVAIKVAELTAEEKVLLSVGYKKVLGPRRASWRKLSSMLKEESNMNKTNRIIECRNKVEKEMSDIYTDIVLIIECILIPSSEDRDPNSAAFYYKMKGDFIRYLAEFKTGNERRVAANQSFKAYESEITCYKSHSIGCGFEFFGLLPQDPWLYVTAIEIARVALDEASSGLELDRSNEEAYKGRDNIMQHLRDNMIVWREAGNKDGDNIPPSA